MSKTYEIPLPPGGIVVQLDPMFRVQKHIHVEALRKFRERLRVLQKYPTFRNQEERERLTAVIAAYERLGKGK